MATLLLVLYVIAVFLLVLWLLLQEFGEDYDEWTRIIAERASDGLATDF